MPGYGATFLACLARLYALEGFGTSTLEGDAGGETYRGIARNYWPMLDLWRYVDAGDLTAAAREAEAFYHAVYWRAIRGDELPEDVAFELFEFGIHTNPGRAVTMLQRALNVLNDRAQRWPDLVEDGRLGPATMAAVQSALRRDMEKDVLNTFNGEQFCYYAANARESAEKERFFRGFLRRIQWRA